MKSPSTTATNKVTLPAEVRSMLETGKVQGRTRSISVVGASTTNNLHTLAALLEEVKPRQTLEIGLACATSALVILDWHRRNNAAGEIEIRHTAIDPFQADLDHVGLELVERAGFASTFRHVPKLSDRALPQLIEEGARFQLIYVDGGHLFEDVFLDLHYSAQLLDVGGVMLLDDSTWPDVSKTIRFANRNMTGSLEQIDLTAYRRAAPGGYKYKLAKMLGMVQLTAFRKVGETRRPWNAKLRNF